MGTHTARTASSAAAWGWGQTQAWRGDEGSSVGMVSTDREYGLRIRNPTANARADTVGVGALGEEDEEDEGEGGEGGRGREKERRAESGERRAETRDDLFIQSGRVGEQRRAEQTS